MKLYFVAVKELDKDTEVACFTSEVKQRAAHKRYVKSAAETTDVFMIGPIDFSLNSKGILAAFEFGVKAKSFTWEQFMEEENAES